MAEKQKAPETEKKKRFSLKKSSDDKSKKEEKAKVKAEKAAAKAEKAAAKEEAKTEKKHFSFGGSPEEKAKLKAEKAAAKAEKQKAKEEAAAERAKAKEEARAERLAAKEAKAKERAEKKGLTYEAKPQRERRPSFKERRAANKALIEEYKSQAKPTMMNVNYRPPTGQEDTFEAKAHTGTPGCYSCCGPGCAITFVGLIVVLIVCCAYVSPKDQPCCSICYWPF